MHSAEAADMIGSPGKCLASEAAYPKRSGATAGSAARCSARLQLADRLRIIGITS